MKGGGKMQISVKPMQQNLEGIIKKKDRCEAQNMDFQDMILQIISIMHNQTNEILDHEDPTMGKQSMEGDLLQDINIENSIHLLQENSTHLINSLNNEPIQIQMSYELEETFQKFVEFQKQPLSKDQVIPLENNKDLDAILEKIDAPLEEMLLKLQSIRTPHTRIDSKTTINLEHEEKEFPNIDKTHTKPYFVQEKTEKIESLIQNSQIAEEFQGEKSKEMKSKHLENKNTNKSLPNIQNLSFYETIEHVDQASQQVEIQNIHEITEEMIREIKVLKDGEQSELQVKLKPKQLGEIEIKIEMKAGQVLGKILVENVAIKGAIESQLQHLKQQLQDQNIVTQKIEVDLQQQSGGYHQEDQSSLFWKGDNSSSRFTGQGSKENQETLMEEGVGQSLIVNSYYRTGEASSINFLV